MFRQEICIKIWIVDINIITDTAAKWTQWNLCKTFIATCSVWFWMRFISSIRLCSWDKCMCLQMSHSSMSVKNVKIPVCKFLFEPNDGDDIDLQI